MPDLREQLQSGLADRYRVERELGRGGMATVFLAHDLRHDRPVALKVLHPQLALALGPDRFQREIKLAARLQHPHILTVHDSGETAGNLWFTMPFVEGESLRDRLTRERQLSVEDAVRITREAAQALQYAHGHGVIHRDIKPENLLLTPDGNTLVADFGIARGLAADDERLTSTGVVIGTPAYMSPEQASGDRQVDARSDVYSLACVLYEMLAGEPPYNGPTAQAMLVKRLTDPVPSVRHARHSVPEQVEQALMKALAPVVADRQASAAEFAQALQPRPKGLNTEPTGPRAAVIPRAGRRRRVPVAAMALGLGVLIGLGVLFAWRRSHPEADSSGGNVLAVLPFENLGDSADAYFADGVTDAVRDKLAALPGLEVIASTSSNQYRHTFKRPNQIGRELGTRYLLVGRVRWAKVPGGTSRVQVRPELIDARSGAERWGEPFDAALTDVFQVQADIAGRVAEALGVALGAGDRERLTERPTGNLAAYDAYLRGEQLVRGREVGSYRRALPYFEQAVALDSAFVDAWAALSDAHTWNYATGDPTAREAEAARLAAARALTLAPGRAEGRLALGWYYELVEGDEQQALEQFTAGLRIEPDNARLLGATAGLTAKQRGWGAGLQLLHRAQALDPRSADASGGVAKALLMLRRYAEAHAAADRALALDPGSLDLIQTKAMIYLAQGNLAEARTVIRSALRRVDPAALAVYFGEAWDLYWVLEEPEQQLLLRQPPSEFNTDRGNWGLTLAETYALRGDRARARAYADSARLAVEEQLRAMPRNAARERVAERRTILGLALAYLGHTAESVREGEFVARLLPLVAHADFGPYVEHQLVRIYLLAGEPTNALDHLEPLLKIPYYLSPGWLKVDPTFAPLRDNPRFERLVNGS